MRACFIFRGSSTSITLWTEYTGDSGLVAMTVSYG